MKVEVAVKREDTAEGVGVSGLNNNKEKGGKVLQLASVGVAYTADTILWDNLGANRLTFMRYHQEMRKGYESLATSVYAEFGVETKVRKYGVEINAFGKQYVYSKDYVTGQDVMAGDDTVFANYIMHTSDVESKRIRGKYLDEDELEEIRRVAVEEFIILPTKVDIYFKEKLLTTSLKRPKDWIGVMEDVTSMLGVECPEMIMVKGDIIVKKGEKKLTTILWKYDKDSVKQLVSVMCGFWEKDEKSNRKPSNQVVRGGGITLVNLTKAQREYREYIDKTIKEAIKKTTKISDVYKINFSNTTTSCYVDFTDLWLKDLKISIRDHEEMHENGYYKFYIDAVGKEDFSDRLAEVINGLVKLRKLKG